MRNFRKFLRPEIELSGLKVQEKIWAIPEKIPYDDEKSSTNLRKLPKIPSTKPGMIPKGLGKNTQKTERNIPKEYEK